MSNRLILNSSLKCKNKLTCNFKQKVITKFIKSIKTIDMYKGLEIIYDYKLYIIMLYHNIYLIKYTFIKYV